jgi:predicted DNA-binding protein
VRTAQSVERRKMGVNISLDLSTLAKLDEEARRAGLTRSALVRRMVDEWAADAEADLALAREAKRRLEDPAEKRVPWEQVKGELGL